MFLVNTKLNKMRCIIYVFLLVTSTSYTQKSDIEMKVLNDTIWFSYHDYNTEFDSTVLFPFASDSTKIETILKFEVINNTNKNYVMFLDTNLIWVHEFSPLPITDTIRYSHEANLMALLYDIQKRRKDSTGSHVRFDYEDIKNMPQIDYGQVIKDYKAKNVKLKDEQIIQNYKFNQNRLYLKANETKTLNIRLKLPYFLDFNYISRFTLKEDEIYYVDFYFHNKCHKTKEALTKAELKELRKKNIHIYGGTIHSDKKIVLMYKENGK